MDEEFENDFPYKVMLNQQQDPSDAQSSPTFVPSANPSLTTPWLQTTPSANRPTWLPLQQHMHQLRHTGLLPAVESSFVHGHRRSASAGVGMGNFSNQATIPSNSPAVSNMQPPTQGGQPLYPTNFFTTSVSASSDSFPNSPTVPSKFSLNPSVATSTNISPRRHAKSHSVASVSSPNSHNAVPFTPHAFVPPVNNASPLPALNTLPQLLRPRNLDAQWRPSSLSQTNSPTHAANPSFPGTIVTHNTSNFRPEGGGHRHRRSTGSLSVGSSGSGFSSGGSGNPRKNLFSPYLPQSSIPALLAERRLVTGILIVSKKNRSDAFVSVDGLDAEVFICGSKDRNRALEGDVVAIELLDVDEVWAGKLEKEENRRRKDPISTRGSFDNLRIDAVPFEVPQRSAIKARDDEQVEGQTLFLLDQKQLGADEKPKYAGHVVAVLQRAPGQVFSGTLGILRPSSAANKERQTSSGNQGSSNNSGNDKPKIVWFKPSDKRVPLIAIPTEQAPTDFLGNDQAYAQRLFLASIKRWPVTSLHPFGMLVGELGSMDSMSAQVSALLHDTGVHSEPWEGSAATSAVTALNALSDNFLNVAGCADYRSEDVFLFVKNDVSKAAVSEVKQHESNINSSSATDFVSSAFHIRPTSTGYHVGIHVTDVSRVIEPGSPLDRELQRRSIAVNLCQKSVPLFPTTLGEALSLREDKDCYTMSLLLDVSSTGKIRGTWIGWAVIRPRKAYTMKEADELLQTDARLRLFHTVSSRLRTHHLGTDVPLSRYCRLVRRWDEESCSFDPNETNLFISSAVEVLRETLLDAANRAVASHLRQEFRENAFLRTQRLPSRENCRILQSMAIQMGCVLDLSSTKSLLRSLSLIEDDTVRNILQLYYYKVTPRAVYEMQKYKGNLASQMMSLGIEDESDDLTHFTAPLERYGDIVVHYQLQLLLRGELASEKRLRVWSQAANDASRRLVISKFAQETSIHIKIFSDWAESQVWQDGLVCFVAPSYFDVFFPSLGMEKRVHLDLLNLTHVRFEEDQGILSLYDESGAVTVVKLLTSVKVKLFVQLSTPPLINVSNVEF
ncbi:cytoplasmic P body 3'-5'-exoribonuclease, Dis3L2-related [Schizosaccharomyces pombe]|uniref:Protein sts5 n=1 Tax=Schizosaccharomyces pombe (strain 972 / ATCC 24843) TaxID=284812 RepID=STS5_SCHPO|nr:RNB-like protein [Schizosaccharomyces pombe]O74454.1 RecName: Full=Protein sts5 [Schizosaccharomyces pombe 972h-]CAA20748.1 RNB-like protein [Schizosaccharomyces pombe]|eukprot:NP_587919.1 RNB-like protein [Schizosaccharomyces pombe]